MKTKIAETPSSPVAIIKEQARLFAKDNYTKPTPRDYLIIESAIMVGYLMAMGGK